MAKIAKKSRQPLKDVLELHASALEKMPGCLEAIYQVANIHRECCCPSRRLVAKR